jgi:hypothetical protein
MYSAHRSFEAGQCHNDADGKFTRALSDGNDVNLFPGNCGKNASRKPRRSAHSFSYNRK